LPHPTPILILSTARPSLRWERISVSHSIATAVSPTTAKEPNTYRYLIGAMSAYAPQPKCEPTAREIGYRERTGRRTRTAATAAFRPFSTVPDTCLDAGLSGTTPTWSAGGQVDLMTRDRRLIAPGELAG